MDSVTQRISIFLMILALAIGITLSTFTYQRYGPFMGVHGNSCGSGDTGELCIEPVLQAGWPLPYVFDSPTISVPEKLFTEDELNLGFFALDVAFFACCVNTVWQLFEKRK